MHIYRPGVLVEDRHGEQIHKVCSDLHISESTVEEHYRRIDQSIYIYLSLYMIMYMYTDTHIYIIIYIDRIYI